jgi:anti-anti-sigma regulatory factor
MQQPYRSNINPFWPRSPVAGYRREPLGEHFVDIQIKPLSDNHALVAIRGHINEESDPKFRMVEEQLRPLAEITFDFEGVGSVDSLGVRSWVQFLRSLKPEQRPIRFINCSADIIAQINMIPSFSEKAKIESFFIDYICPSCEGTLKALAQTSAIAIGKHPEPPNCPHCKQSPMETEELEDEYFAFLDRRL